MSKKSFKDIATDNPALAFLSTDKPGKQDTRPKSPVKSLEGKKAKESNKPPRINIAFTSDNLEYLRLICRVKGIRSITAYINALIEADTAQNKDIITRARKVLQEGGLK